MRLGRDPLNVGEHVIAVLTQAEGSGGRVVLSRRRVRNRKQWTQVEDMKKNGTMVEATVLEANRGVVVDVGVRGFVPLSQLVSGRLQGAVRQPTRYRSDR
jgi:ribosomal protein S1